VAYSLKAGKKRKGVPLKKGKKGKRQKKKFKM